MTYDTTKDPRIITAQLACALLKKCVKQKSAVQLKISKDKVGELVSACESAVMTLVYMYREPGALAASEPSINLSGSVNAIADAYGKLLSNKDDQTLLRANIRWCLRTLKGLRNRLTNPGSSLASGVDLAVVQVRSAVKSSGFLKTRVTDGSEDYTVVTNLVNVEANWKLAAAFLPPREVGGMVSEAMFLGSGKRNEAPGALLGENQVDAKEAASILYEAVSKPPK